MQFDRASEESYEEKRTNLTGVVLKANNPLERHASKIYTHKMFEMFQIYIYESGDYQVEVIIPNKQYKTIHRKLLQ